MCKGCAKSMLQFFNGLGIFVGLSIAAVASYLIYEQEKHQVFGTDDHLSWSIWVPFAVGLFVAIFYGVSCCVAGTENRCCLGFFGCLQLFFTFVVLLTGAFLLSYDYYMDNVAYVPVGDLKPGLAETQWMLYDFTLGTFEGCCNSPLVPPPTNCSSLASDNKDSVLDYCILLSPSEPYDTGLIADDEFCDALNDPESLNWCAGYSGTETERPTVDPTAAPTTVPPTMAPTVFDPNATAAPTTLEPTEAPVPAPIVVLSGDDLHSFQVAWYQYTHDFVWPAGIAFMAFGVVLLITTILSCCMACSPSKKDKYEKVGEKTESKAAKDTKTVDAESGNLEVDEGDSLTMT